MKHAKAAISHAKHILPSSLSCRPRSAAGLHGSLDAIAVELDLPCFV